MPPLIAPSFPSFGQSSLHEPEAEILATIPQAARVPDTELLLVVFEEVLRIDIAHVGIDVEVHDRHPVLDDLVLELFDDGCTSRWVDGDESFVEQRISCRVAELAVVAAAGGA